MAADFQTHVHDHAGAGVLETEQCLALVRGERLGRVGFVRAGTVEVLPVNYVLLGTTIAFKSGYGSKLGAALDGAPITFEVDGVGYTGALPLGWSVVVKGTAGFLADDERTALLLAGAPLPSLPSAAATGRWIVIRAEEITGRTVPFT
ncbi:pyridoxamine 5'-phosphate oxidase family protein [Cryptosporangium arvum]|jgi:nitroimidazol reductase NimA-like FMN-containing flavoprotein (pyridoxamine 5'-phosphate oxidase superfamily)|uniref:Flavin-nucleotide-binding protein n=1 Tax=Cryptosporangium arvum DSM 44712 TaxID=927661 RepID=A0A010YQK9_9ACTN|nr:pyridoxamine 5'-phosphate oxidase family protein [Cryptosporangium arvum]EXG82485.1 hypothetical protein CryarDRAFT_3673 [Cryptosporangium arvum DSM 44712]